MKRLFLLCIGLCGTFPLPCSADPGNLSHAGRMEYDLTEEAHREALAKVREPLAKLDEKYLAALEKRKAAAQAAGELDAVIVADEALKSFAAGKTPEENAKDAEVAKITKVYLAEHKRISATLNAGTLAAWKKYRAAMEALVGSLTKEGKIEDAKIVREEIPAIDRSIAELGVVVSPDAAKWNGEWDVKYVNNATRRLRIRMEDAKTLKIEAIGGDWEPKASFTAKFDETKGCFYAPQVAPEGTPLRSETYVLESKRILIRHWLPHEGATYEKPSVRGTAQPSKE